MRKVALLAHVWPPVLLYAFPPLALIPPTLSRVREHRHTLILIAPTGLQCIGWRRYEAAVRVAVAAPVTQGHTVSGRVDYFSPTPGTLGTMGLAREWYHLSTVGLPQKVINTIQSARASSTRSL